MKHTESTHRYAVVISAFLVCCSLIALAGIDLVLPAVPQLPQALGGTIAEAQYVLAAFAMGAGLGLLMFGELGARLQQRWLLLGSLVSYALMSEIASMSNSIEQLVVWRFLQGLASSCAAVVAPGMIKTMFDEVRALRAMGILGSVESLAPALAPLLGVWLFTQFGWQSSFHLTAALAASLALVCLCLWRHIPCTGGHRNSGSYSSLLTNAGFHKYAMSQAMALGGLLVFVFAAPSIITLTMDGQLSDFIVMQICGIATFIFGANLSSKLVEKFGPDKVIWNGSVLSWCGALGLLVYALVGGNDPTMICVFFVPFNMGLGFRGPPSFYQALVASNGDDARGSALLILFVMLVTALGTITVAPWLTVGLTAITTTTVLITSLSFLFLLLPSEQTAVSRSE